MTSKQLSSALGNGVLGTEGALQPSFLSLTFPSLLLSLPVFFVHFLYRSRFPMPLSARSVSVTQRYHCSSAECAGNDSTPFPETASRSAFSRSLSLNLSVSRIFSRTLLRHSGIVSFPLAMRWRDTLNESKMA